MKTHWLALVLVWSGMAAADTTRSLSSFVSNLSPWLKFEGDSEQGTPYYVGALPRDLALGKGRKPLPQIPQRLKARGEAQALHLAKLLGQPAIELEAWPYPHWKGQVEWAFARWRPAGTRAWKWLRASQWKKDAAIPEPELPTPLRSWEADEAKTIFTDFLQLTDLYEKPVFGHCVWTDEKGSVLAGWLPPDLREAYQKKIQGKRSVCHQIHQAAWFNESPITFTVGVRNGRVDWPNNILWTAPLPDYVAVTKAPVRVKTWPASYEADFRNDLLTVGGEQDALFPISGRRFRFTKKSSAQYDHHLNVLIEYLEERYRKLGVATQRQKFNWRGIAQANLIAVLPGSDPTAKPILLADHIDTVFSEDVFEHKNQRVTTHGADDNCTAVVSLLRAAEVVVAQKIVHKRPIWLLHITGEEFPSDGIGTRHFLNEALKKRLDFAGVVQIDMIGWRNAGDKIYQVASGDSAESLKLASVALGAAQDLTPNLEPKFRSRYDSESYLYNTDGIFYSHLGYPVILFNEHLNAKKMDNPYYHQSSDVTANVDVGYAASISRVAIETVLRLANYP